jgi:hypothetical protein
VRREPTVEDGWMAAYVEIGLESSHSLKNHSKVVLVSFDSFEKRKKFFKLY